MIPWCMIHGMRPTSTDGEARHTTPAAGLGHGMAGLADYTSKELARDYKDLRIKGKKDSCDEN